MSLPISLDPYTIIKNYQAGKQEKKVVDHLLNKHYRIQTSNRNVLCKLLNISKLDNGLILTVESEDGQLNIPFKNIEYFEEVKNEEYEFPQKLKELLSISKSREEQRPSYLNWILSSSKPIRDSANDWFDKEYSQIIKQLDILVSLFPHRNYEQWVNEAKQIKEDFKKAIDELDRVLNLVKEGKATKISDIYREKERFSLPKEDEAPNILNALIGIFNVSTRLDAIIKRVDEKTLDIKDTTTIAKIYRISKE
jgi:hypothetical protein